MSSTRGVLLDHPMQCFRFIIGRSGGVRMANWSRATISGRSSGRAQIDKDQVVASLVFGTVALCPANMSSAPA
jgi:hypothetical protein